jgi:hypothetical protein
MLRKVAIALLLLLGTAAGARAQSSGGNVGNTVLVRFTGVPSGACLPNQEAINNATTDFYVCNTSFAWVKVGSGGGGGGISITLNQIAAGSGTNTIGAAGLWTIAGDSPNTLGCFDSDDCNIEIAGMTTGSFIAAPGNLFINDTGGFNGLSYNAGVVTIGDNAHASGQIILRDAAMSGSVTLGEVEGKEFNVNGNGIMSATNSNTDLNGTITASGGTATYSFTRTFAVAPICLARDETTLASLLSVSVNTTTLTVTTAGMTDHVSYICFGRS